MFGDYSTGTQTAQCVQGWTLRVSSEASSRALVTMQLFRACWPEN